MHKGGDGPLLSMRPRAYLRDTRTHITFSSRSALFLSSPILMAKAFEAQAREALGITSRGPLEHDLLERQHTLAPRCLSRTDKPWWKSLMRIFVFTDSPTTMLMVSAATRRGAVLLGVARKLTS
jgi:hypothetical protein